MDATEISAQPSVIAEPQDEKVQDEPNRKEDSDTISTPKENWTSVMRKWKIIFPKSLQL
ncbi:MAG: hypothetical protein Q8829_02845 [Candidatus Phytoplasma australasiaticum]|nr:hypothetical protein [Candidatus Phytoplasma australasiaticum]